MIMLGFLYKYIVAYFINTYAIMLLQLDLHGFVNLWLYTHTAYIYSLTLQVIVYLR